MSLLFYLNKDNTAALHPDAVRLCPSLATLSPAELLYVILYVDYHSPYRQYPEHERKRKAMWHAFQENELELIESASMRAAVEDYHSLQYNSKKEIATAYQKKIDLLQHQLMIDESPSSIKKIGDAIDDLRKRIRELENEYVMEMQKQGVIKGGKELSFTEKFQANQKAYNSLLEKK